MNPKAIAAWVAGSGVGIAILLAAMQFWISVNVKQQLAEAGIVPVATVTAISTRVENLEELHESDQSETHKDIERVESKAERIAQILMED
jgi:uncharacterized protein Yka (UPF0111/DUF47 family)